MIDARLQLHWAVQVLARFGDAHVPARPDFSHSALTWDTDQRRFRTEADPEGRRLEFDPVAFSYRLSGGDDGEAVFELTGGTLDEALTWLSSLQGESTRLEIGEPDVPAHPVADGARFDPDVADLEALADWFHQAHQALSTVRQARAAASPVRCWPHHLDIAVLIPLDGPDADPEEARSVGAGMTPGDGTYPEPYWYVTPWPYPVAPELSPLPSGAGWHTDGWIGAVLRGEDVIAAGEEGLGRYLAAAIDACEALAGT
jgi:hypothetical protein